VKVYLFDFGVGSHHDVLAPERNREHSFRDQLSALNVVFMDPLRSDCFAGAVDPGAFHGDKVVSWMGMKPSTWSFISEGVHPCT
ncbi:hypothetical protein, partial [Pseudomonas aeruginosa]|uniref:hypothetical protein n=1 Tax=Pseudomonas aeruginosa TaxID=287 RepID=UPI001E5D4836